MESCSVLVSKCENVPRGTALLLAELVVPAELAPLLELAFDVLDVSALTGGASEFAEGVKSGEVVSALEPAEVEPLPVDDAGAPVVFAAEFA